MSLNSHSETAAGRDRVPPAAVKRAAQQGLDLRKQHGRGGIGPGQARARQLVAGGSIPVADLVKMRSYFARHEVDKRSPGWNEPSNGKIAWLLWGGDAGKAWCERQLASEETAAAPTDPQPGERVKVKAADGRLYAATVVKGRGKTYTIRWANGTEARVHADHIQPKAAPKPAPKPAPAKSNLDYPEIPVLPAGKMRLTEYGSPEAKKYPASTETIKSAKSEHIAVDAVVFYKYSTRGFVIAGSSMRWQEPKFSVTWTDRSGATQGRSFPDTPKGEDEAQAYYKRLIEATRETAGATPTEVYTVEAIDRDGALLRLLEYLQKTSLEGHSVSFEIDDQRFGFDGDGDDKIVKITKGKP